MKLAEELGRAVADSARYKSLRELEKAVEADEEASGLQKQYTEIALRMQSLEQEGKPLAPEHNRALQSCTEDLARNAKIQDLTRAWADYNEMIVKVNTLVFEKLDPKKEE